MSILWPVSLFEGYYNSRDQYMEISVEELERTVEGH